MFFKSTHATTNEMLTTNGEITNQMKSWANGYCDATKGADFVMHNCRNTQNPEPSTEIMAIVFDCKSGSIIALWSLTVTYN
jgi:hypothetical protein